MPSELHTFVRSYFGKLNTNGFQEKVGEVRPDKGEDLAPDGLS